MKFTIKIIFLFFAFNSWALNIDKKLDNPKLEMQALKIFKNIKCPTCPSQSIAESQTSSSANLRILIREKLLKGKTRREIETDLVKKYGSTILLTPPITYQTYLLWFFPLIFISLTVKMFYKKYIDKN